MSYELKIDEKSRAAGRLIGSVRKGLILAAIEAKKETGISQQDVASQLGINKSVVNRLLRGNANLTLRTIAELAWALGYEIVFSIRKKQNKKGENIFREDVRPRQIQFDPIKGAQISKRAPQATFELERVG